VSRLAWCAIAVAVASCGGGSSNNSTSASNGSTSGGSESSSASPSSGSTESAGDNSAERHGGLQLHIQNVHAGGALPNEADPPTDHLDVSFELAFAHNGTEPLTGLTVTHARLVHDDGREVTFGVIGTDWDGRLAVGQQRTVAFHKTPDSAHPRATHTLCGQHMRLDVTVDLSGREAHAFSRHVPIDCPH
jgi:hypothetical protein